MSTSTTVLDMSRPIDLISMGRVAVDFYAEQVGSPLDKAQSFRKYLGGCAGNIAVGTSRLGLKPAMFSCIGKDDMGLFLKNTLENEGIDTSLLVTRAEHLTGLVILGIDPPDRFPLIFYRENCADMQIQPGDTDADFFAKSKALLITGTGFSTDSMRKTTLHTLELAKSVGTAIILDIDYRPVLWGLTDPGDGESRYAQSTRVTERMQVLLPYLDLIVGTEEEIRIMGGGQSLEEDIAIIRKKSQAPIVVKKGEKGCTVFPRDFSQPVEGVPYPVEVLNVLGAGDAFMSGFLRGWLRNENWEICARFGNANGALVVSRHGCAPSMASFDELTYFMDNYEKNPHILTSIDLAVKHQYTQLGSPRENNLMLLAFDQVDEFESSFPNGTEGGEKIRVFKRKIFEGFLSAKEDSSLEGLGILTDACYGRDALKKSAYETHEQGISMDSDFLAKQDYDNPMSPYQLILERPSYTFIKVALHLNREIDRKQLDNQIIRLLHLYKICSTLDRRLMVELVVEGLSPQDSSYPEQVIREIYESSIFPFWWQLPAPGTKAELDGITGTIESFDPNAAVIIRIDNTNTEKIKQQFEMTAPTTRENGFSTGEALFRDIWEKFMAGTLNADEIPSVICNRYLKLLSLWQATGCK